MKQSPGNEDQKSKVEQTLASFQTDLCWFEPSPQPQCRLEGAQASLVGLLEALSALVFKSYPSVSSLRVQIVNSTSQISREHTPQHSVLAINP